MVSIDDMTEPELREAYLKYRKILSDKDKMPWWYIPIFVFVLFGIEMIELPILNWFKYGTFFWFNKGS